MGSHQCLTCPIGRLVRAVYTGTETLTFSQYIDAGTGKTLRAEPGGVYDVTPASGHVVPEIPAAWFVPADSQGRADAEMWPVDGEAEGDVPEVPAEG